jgi:MFS family permease
MAKPRITGAVLVSLLALAKADSAIIGVVAPALRTEFHLDDARLGLLASLSAVTGALCALPAGGLIDRRRRPVVISVALVAWSLALGVAGLATGIAVLVLARLVGSGIASVARPAAVSLVGDAYPPDRRGAVLGALDAGQTGGAAGCFLVGALALHFLTWRWAFWGLAVAGFLLAVAAARLSDPAHRGAVPADGLAGGVADEPSLLGVLGELVRIRTNAVVLVADAVGNFFYAGVTSFSVIFVTERYRLSAASVDAIAPIVGVAVIAGLLVGGRIGDRMARRWGGVARLALSSATDLVAAVLLVPAVAVHSLPLAGGSLMVGAAVLAAGGPCNDAVRLDVVRPAIRGRAEAARGLLTLSSSAVAPVAFGVLAMSFGGSDDHGAGLGRAFLVMLLPLAASGVILLAGLRYYSADALRAGSPPLRRPARLVADGGVPPRR